MRSPRLVAVLFTQALVFAAPTAIGAWSDRALDAPPAPVVLESHAPHRSAAPRIWAGASFEPQLVFYPRGACDSEQIEIELWDRYAMEWLPHDRHPRLHTDSCAVEDAGVLLNEIRIRCVDPAGRRRPSGWRTGADVRHPRTEERCALLDGGGTRALEIAITSPGTGELVIAEDGLTQIRGAVLSAQARGDGSAADPRLAAAPARDIIVAIDAAASGTSASASRAALLDAQRDAVHTMLRALAPRLGRVRIGLVSHAADTARVEVPLGDDLAVLRAGLDAISLRGPNTDPSYSAPLALATDVLVDREDPPSADQTMREKVVYLLFDTGATPDPRHDPLLGPTESTGAGADAARAWARRVEVAHRARQAGVELHVLALMPPGSGAGPDSAPRSWPALYAIPSSFTPVPAPAARSDWLERVALARIARVRVDNLTTGESAPEIELFPSGAFAGAVPVGAGRNHLRIAARSGDGRVGRVDLEIEFRPPTEADLALEAERERMKRVREARNKSLEMEIEGP